MFYSRQIYTFLVESISNYVFKEEKKIDFDSKKTEAIPRGVSQSRSLLRDVRNFKKYLQRSSFFGKKCWKKRLEA